MSTKLVSWISTNCLPCACKGTVNVIICTIFNQTVPGQIIESSATSGCETGSWKYQIQYDSDDLPEGVTALATTDISGVACKGCLTTWIEEQFASSNVQSVVESEFIDSFDFGGQPNGSSETLTLTIVNPSATQTLSGALHWSWSLNAQATTGFSASIDSLVNADGVLIPDSENTLHIAESVPGGIDHFIVGTSGFIPYDIPAGATVDFDLVLTSSFTTEPNGEYVASKPRIMFMGVTVAP